MLYCCMYDVTGTKGHGRPLGQFLIACSRSCCMRGHRSRTIGVRCRYKYIIVVRCTMPARGRYSWRKNKNGKKYPTKPWTHDRNTQQQRSYLPTHLQQYSRTSYNSNAHEAIHPPMYYSSAANDVYSSSRGLER